MEEKNGVKVSDYSCKSFDNSKGLNGEYEVKRAICNP